MFLIGVFILSLVFAYLVGSVEATIESSITDDTSIEYYAIPLSWWTRTPYTSNKTLFSYIEPNGSSRLSYVRENFVFHQHLE